jgi:hypothetical protein
MKRSISGLQNVRLNRPNVHTELCCPVLFIMGLLPVSEMTGLRFFLANRQDSQEDKTEMKKN